MLQQVKRKSKDSKEKHHDVKRKSTKCKSSSSSSDSKKIVSENVVSENIEKNDNIEDIVPVPDENFNQQQNVLSRDVSIENQMPLDTQIEQGIMNLLEQEISKVDKKQYPPRPQSLSFYEDELTNEDAADLSGQLSQVLSPTYSKMKSTNFYVTNANSEIDNKTSSTIGRLLETGNNTIHAFHVQHAQNRRDSDSSLGTSNHSNGGEPLDSYSINEIKKHKKHRKHKKSNSGEEHSSSHKKRLQKVHQSFFNEAYQPQAEILMALNDLQDDVFDGPIPVHSYNHYGEAHISSTNYVRVMPRLPTTNKVYIERKNMFEPKIRNELYDSNDSMKNYNDADGPKRLIFSDDLSALDIAICFQVCWMSITTFCHGLLAGLGLAHLGLIFLTQYHINLEAFVCEFVDFSEFYSSLFFILSVICVVSVLDRFDISHCNLSNIREAFIKRKYFIVIFVYLVTLSLTLANVEVDSSFRRYCGIIKSENTLPAMVKSKILFWSRVSIARSISAVLGWMLVGFLSNEDLLSIHLQGMLKYENK